MHTINTLRTTTKSGASWDDNWGRYEWTSDVRIRGIADSGEAAREMFKGLMDRWGYDLSDNERASYKEFLDSIGA